MVNHNLKWLSGWWFGTMEFYWNPNSDDDPIWRIHIFQGGWNHQLAKFFRGLKLETIKQIIWNSKFESPKNKYKLIDPTLRQGFEEGVLIFGRKELTCSNLLKLCIRNLVEWDVAVEGGDGGCESELECLSENLQNFANIRCRTVSAATFFQVCATTGLLLARNSRFCQSEIHHWHFTVTWWDRLCVKSGR